MVAFHSEQTYILNKRAGRRGGRLLHYGADERRRGQIREGFCVAGRDHVWHGDVGPARPEEGNTIADHGRREIGPLEGDVAQGQDAGRRTRRQASRGVKVIQHVIRARRRARISADTRWPAHRSADGARIACAAAADASRTAERGRRLRRCSRSHGLLLHGPTRGRATAGTTHMCLQGEPDRHRDPREPSRIRVQYSASRVTGAPGKPGPVSARPMRALLREKGDGASHSTAPGSLVAQQGSDDANMGPRPSSDRDRPEMGDPS